MLSDLRFALRSLLKTPGFTVVALLTLALGIGVNTSMFSVLRTLFWRTLPYAEPQQLVRVHRTTPSSQTGFVSPANFLDLREQSTAVDRLAAGEWAGFSLTEDGRPAEWLSTLRVTADFFPLLGTAPLLGRVFTTEEDQPGADNVLVLSHGYWESRFGRDPDVVGRTLKLNGTSVTIIGVMPRGFEDPLLWGPISAWRPIAFAPTTRANRGNHSLTVVARLKPGVSLQQAGKNLGMLGGRLATAHPDANAKAGLRVALLSRGSQVDDGQITLFVCGLALFVLLIACANLANLQFARTAGRAREYAVRAALGASRLRLVRAILTESLLLSLGGGMLGVLTAVWVNDLLGRHFFFGTQRGLDFPLDWRGLVFAFATSALTGIAFGLLPAWLATRASVASTLQQSPRGATSAPGAHRVRQTLIVAEVALALVLLASAAFFLGGLKRLTHRDPGWSPDGLLFGYITLAPPASADTTPEDRARFRRDLVERIETRLAELPGVDGTAFVRALPTLGYPGSQRLRVEGQPLPPPGQEPVATVAPVSPGFFNLFKVQLLQGRTFTAADRADSTPVVVINETMARLLWPGRNPIGQRIGNLDPAKPDWCEVIGVVRDSRPLTPFQTGGNSFQLYRPWHQLTLGGGAIVVRARTDPAALGPALQRAMAELAPDLPVRNISTVRENLERNFANLELAGWTLTCFALLGLLLAAIGIYGVLAHHVAQRTSEIGIRMALGAQVRDVLTMVLGQGLRLSLLGAGLGLAGAFAMGRLLGSIMPGLPDDNLLTTVAVTVVLVAVAALACWLPARRAAKVDPIIALRAE